MSRPALDEAFEQLFKSADSINCQHLLPGIAQLLTQHNARHATEQQLLTQAIERMAGFMREYMPLNDQGRLFFDNLHNLSGKPQYAGLYLALSEALSADFIGDGETASPASSATPGTASTATATMPVEETAHTPSHENPGNPDNTDDTHDTAKSAFLSSIRSISNQSQEHFHELLRDNQLHNDEIKSLRKTLQGKLDSTKHHFSEFEVDMQAVLRELQVASNSQELEKLRYLLDNAITRLLSRNRSISDNMLDVARELDLFESHCRQLNHELGLVKQLSMTDELTRLPNRRAFLKRLENESGRVQRYGYPLAVALIDLDLFKDINDTYGHAVGDQVLENYTHQVLSTFRNYDLVARYGGEEFAVLLPHTDIYGAERALNKVLQKASQTRIDINALPEPLPLPSFSAGVTAYREGESIDNTLNRADKAMYQAKKMGRNRVITEAE